MVTTQPSLVLPTPYQDQLWLENMPTNWQRFDDFTIVPDPSEAL